MKRLLSGLFISGAVVLAVRVLAGVEGYAPNKSRIRRSNDMDEAPTLPEPAAKTDDKPSRNFSIKRTKSEVGYVYWILEGYGPYKCFILCDSWDEAMAQAKARLAEVDGASADFASAASSLA